MTPVTRSLIFGIVVSFLSCCQIYWVSEHNYKLTLLMAACYAFLTFCMVQDIKKIYERDRTC